MNNLHRILIATGVILIMAGVGLYILQKLHIPIGKLPGDIFIQKGNFSFYFPITTCIIISIILTAIFYLLRK